MIESLSGLHETVNYHQNTKFRLYNNTEAENYPPHWHTPYELIMPTEGSYRVVCGEHSYELREGDVIIIAPGIVHELFAPPSGTRIIFQPEFSSLSLREIDVIAQSVSPAVLITREGSPEIYQPIRELMLAIRNEFFAGEPFMETSVFSRFLQILVLVGRAHAETMWRSIDATASKQKEYLDKITSICNYINEHYAEDLNLDDIAEQAGFSKYHLARLFRQVTNVSLYKYISRRRIAQAKELLISGEYSIMEVAYLSGFSSHGTFTRMFRQVTGVSPNEFRKMYVG
jgi:AraC-like DNA-binding protein